MLQIYVKEQSLILQMNLLFVQVHGLGQFLHQTVGNLQINREEYKIIKDGISIVLPRKEFELLYLLASKPGKVFTF